MGEADEDVALLGKSGTTMGNQHAIGMGFDNRGGAIRAFGESGGHRVVGQRQRLGRYRPGFRRDPTRGRRGSLRDQALAANVLGVG